ncbi:transcriptional regulator, TetR family [Saccharopolyspora kobensis]|uniref:Transcriptional regulator, TetR family n=1 Tax=Saccharopolyspora kobensis TaxID=146035 RepID=A0A1H5ZUH4_9PSEU|nr:TetR/AcrR family transcriptional regulator [Saccharopolyspora kobensis]SEG39624.1 transcriptional regulator, TetR family [Saccharopolyspora kobensis]SFE14079.1 transcriptional regulator, TetR family [Saccharopolyspora kobensis]
MGRTTGRTPEDTRRLLLDAAAQVISTQGVGATLDVIARHAGISKGGLVYHFASKQALLIALAQEQLDGFRDCVHEQIADPEGTPGRLTRAYVRANLAPFDGDEVIERFSLIAQLLTVPEILEMSRADERRWQRDMEADGIPLTAQRVILAAADGIAARPVWTPPDLEPEVRRDLESALLGMIDAAVAGAEFRL